MLDPTFIDSYASADALYQKIDARVKTGVTISFILAVVLTVGNDPFAAVPFCLFPVTLFLISGVPLTALMRRLIPALPFIVLASIAVWFSRGERAAAASTVKALLSVVSVILLVSTTRFSNLLRGLEGLMMPRFIVALLAFIYRYFFIIADEYGHIRVARDSRSFGGGHFRQWKTIGHGVGTLFLHSLERGEAVYSAMAARGYSGEIRTIGVQRIERTDIIFAVVSLGYLLMIMTV